MYMIEIKEDKFEKMAEYTEKMLKYGGKLMSCISELGEEHGMSFRDGMNYRNEDEYSRSMMGSRGGYGSRGGMNYREEDWDDEEMSERRGGGRRRSNGRYY